MYIIIMGKTRIAILFLLLCLALCACVGQPSVPRAPSLSYLFDGDTQSYRVRLYRAGTDGTDECIIPDEYDDGVHGRAPVTAIDNFAFQNVTLCKLTLPSSLTIIRQCSFYRCRFEETVVLPDRVQMVEPCAFLYSVLQVKTDKNPYYSSECNCLTEKATGKLLVGSADGILPDDILSIEYGAFYGREMEKVTIPGSVRRIGTKAFFDCEKLSEVTFSEGIEIIEDFAFSSCTALRSLRLPDSLLTVDAAAFSGCTSLRDVRTGTGTVYILESAFTNCTSLETLTLSPGVRYLGRKFVYGCSALKYLNFPDEDDAWIGTKSKETWEKGEGENEYLSGELREKVALLTADEEAAAEYLCRADQVKQ